jgi:predicted nucleic-acid-binding Zn-ribbon protein
MKISDHPCPECGGNARQEESGEYAMVQVTDGRIQLHTDAPNTVAFVVRAEACMDCGYVTLYSAP